MADDHEARAEQIRAALAEEGEIVTRWVVVYETAGEHDQFSIQWRASADPPWVLHGLLSWAAASTLDEASDDG